MSGTVTSLQLGKGSRAKRARPITVSLKPAPALNRDNRKSPAPPSFIRWVRIDEASKILFAQELIKFGHVIRLGSNMEELADEVHYMVMKTKDEHRARKALEESLVSLRQRRQYPKRRNSKRTCQRCGKGNFNTIKEKIWCNDCYIQVHEAIIGI